MLKSISINFDLIEMMQFYWESVVSRDKVADSYFIEVANNPQMSVLYDEDFTVDSFRKVLSAIMNRERLNNPTKKESRFWNLNMWMLEDLDNMRAMLQPVKVLNLDELKAEFPESEKEKLVVNFIPGHDMLYTIDDGVLTINFFKIMVDYVDPSIIKIDGVLFKDFVLDKVREALA